MKFVIIPSARLVQVHRGMNKVSGIILAGGHSLRMGRDKTLLKIDQETLIERTVRMLKEVSDDVVIASNGKHKYCFSGLVEVPDVFPEMGPLGGIHAGLRTVKHDYAIVISSDMPFFTTALLQLLLSYRKGYDVVVPEVNGKREPLCAIYSRRCIEPIEDCLRSNIRQVIQLYQRVRVCEISGDKLIKLGDVKQLFFNLNTPEDLVVAQQKVK